MFLQRLWSCLWVLALVVAGVAAQDEEEREIRRVALRTHSLSPPYLDSDMRSRWFDFGGDTIVRTDQYIRLTADRPSQQGWLFSRVPITATNWEVEVEFKLHGSGNLHGDGFAMWITKQRGTTGPVFGSADNFEGLGIFFDTYKNNRPGVSFPYVMAMMGDGNTPYDQAHDGKANEIGGCQARALRDSSIPTKARLTYFQDRSLTLELQYKSDYSWTKCFSLTPTDDQPIRMPSISYLGFSAGTGELSDNHDIVNVQSHNLYSPVSSSQGSGPGSGSRPADTSRDKRSYNAGRKAQRNRKSWAWFFFKIFLFIATVGAAYVGYTAYRSRQRRARF